MDSKDIDFVARHYRKGLFSVRSGWRRLGIGTAVRIRRLRIVAAIAAMVILSGTAAIIYRNNRAEDVQEQSVPVRTVGSLDEVKVIDFEDASLTDVVAKIESTYDVKVGGLPESPEEYRLSLHYEGTPVDLIATINDILGTQMTVTEKRQ